MKDLEMNNAAKIGWTGVTKNNNNWIYKSNNQNIRMAAWKTQPGSGGVVQKNCALIDSDGTWVDSLCFSKRPYICQTKGVLKL